MLLIVYVNKLVFFVYPFVSLVVKYFNTKITKFFTKGTKENVSLLVFGSIVGFRHESLVPPVFRIILQNPHKP